MQISGERRLDIERAKGLAILFVVFGHLVARADPLHVCWYEPIRRAVYSFHMPFFLYLSGFVAVLSGAIYTPPQRWRHLATARAERLLVPFFVLGALIVIGKAVAARFVFVDNPPADFTSGFADLIWHTANSSALSVWYLFVLFVVCIMAAILVWVDRGRFRLLIGAGLLLYVLPLPQYLYLDHIGKYAVFFGIGAWAAAGGEGWNHFIDQYWHRFFIVLLCATVVIALYGAEWPVKLELLPIGIISMPALHGLVRHVSLSSSRLLLWFGRNSFMIYLFNTIFIGIAKGVLLRVTNWDGTHFLPFAVVLMGAGSLGPVLLKDKLFHHVKVIDRYTA